jgi:hypothetical protein
MLAIEKPFPVVQASLGGFASLALGFIGSVALLSVLVPNEQETPDSNPKAPAIVAQATDSPKNSASVTSPQQYTSTYSTPASTWRKTTMVRTSSVSSDTKNGTKTTTSSATNTVSQTTTETPASTATSPAAPITPTPGMGSVGSQPPAPNPIIIVPTTDPSVITDPLLPLDTTLNQVDQTTTPAAGLLH